MATALTVYPDDNANSATLSTAYQLVTPTGGSLNVTNTCLIGTVTGYREMYSHGDSNASPGYSSIQPPTGNGWFFDPTTLDGQMMIAGNWSGKSGTRLSTGTCTATFYYRAFVYQSGVYTLIGTLQTSSTAYSSGTSTSDSMAAVSFPVAFFPAGSKLYLDEWVNVTVAGSSGATLGTRQSGGVNAGNTGVQLVTSGYQPYIALAVECDGIGTVQLSTLSVVCSGIGSLILTLIASLDLGTVTFSGVGTFTPTLTTSNNVSLSVTMSGAGTFTPTLSASTVLTDTISGSGLLSATASYSTALAIIIPGIGIISVALSANLDLGTATLSGTGTLTATLSASTVLVDTFSGVGTLSGTLSTTTNVNLAVTMSGVGTLTGAMSASTVLTDVLSGAGMFSATFSLSTALSDAISGAGVLSATLSATTPLTVTVAAVGTIAVASPSLSTALSFTISGTGAIGAQWTLTTALATTISCVGTLSATLTTTAGVNLVVTMSGAGTLAIAAPALSTALNDSFAGAGSVVATGSFVTTLATTVSGIGTLAGIGTFTTALSATFSGAGVASFTINTNGALTSIITSIGTLSATLSASTTLSASFAGTGTLVGTFAYSVALVLTASGTSSVASVVSLSTALTAAASGVGEVGVQLSLATALSGMVSAVGTLFGGLVTLGAFSVTFFGIGSVVFVIRVGFAYPFNSMQVVVAKLDGSGTNTAQTFATAQQLCVLTGGESVVSNLSGVSGVMGKLQITETQQVG